MADHPPQVCHCLPFQKEAVLTLDGGGIRGYVSLKILQQLFNYIRDIELQDGLRNEHDSHPNPCEYFDYIIGTSAGGITAIMLGRLRMNIQQSLDVYTNLATRIFAKRRPLWKYHKYDHYQLEQLMAGVVKANCPDHQPLDVPLLTNPRDLAEYGRGHPNLNQLRYTQCRIAVLAMKTSDDNDQLYALRSYRNRTKANPRILNPDHHINASIQNAARATSAAPTYFRPAKIDGNVFFDGGVEANNPSHRAWYEVISMHRKNPERCEGPGIACFVSIGTGKGAQRKLLVRGSYVRKLYSIVRRAVDSMTDPEPVHHIMEAQCSPGVYHRFNVQRGLENMAMDECQMHRDTNLTFLTISGAVQDYVDNTDARDHLQRVARQLIDHRRARQDAARQAQARVHAKPRYPLGSELPQSPVEAPSSPASYSYGMPIHGALNGFAREPGPSAALHSHGQAPVEVPVPYPDGVPVHEAPTDSPQQIRPRAASTFPRSRRSAELDRYA